MDENEIYEESTTAGQRWHWSFLVMRVLVFVANLFGAVERMFAGVAEDVAAHANYRIERDQFRSEAGRELEALAEGLEDR